MLKGQTLKKTGTLLFPDTRGVGIANGGGFQEGGFRNHLLAAFSLRGNLLLQENSLPPIFPKSTAIQMGVVLAIFPFLRA